MKSTLLTLLESLVPRAMGTSETPNSIAVASSYKLSLQVKEEKEDGGEDGNQYLENVDDKVQQEHPIRKKPVVDARHAFIQEHYRELMGDISRDYARQQIRPIQPAVEEPPVGLPDLEVPVGSTYLHLSQ